MGNRFKPQYQHQNEKYGYSQARILRFGGIENNDISGLKIFLVIFVQSVGTICDRIRAWHAHAVRLPT